MIRNLLLLLFLTPSWSVFAQNEQIFLTNEFTVDGVKENMPAFEAGIGTVSCKSTFGFEVIVKQCGACTVSGVSLGYRVHKIGDTPGGFSTINASRQSATPDGSGCEDIIYSNGNIQSNILQNLENGTYQLDIYFQSEGTTCNPNQLKSAEFSTIFTYAKHPEILFQPIDLVNCAGQDMFFKTDATGEGTLTYQWERSDNAGAFVKLTATSRYVNPDTKTLKVNNIITDNHDDTFRCVISDANECVITTRAASATVSRKSTILSTGNDVCEGDMVTLNSRILEDDGIPSGMVNSYQWQYRSGSTYTDVVNDANFSGATTEALTINNMPTEYTRYRVEMFFNTVEMDDSGNEVNNTCRLVENEDFTIYDRPARPSVAISPIERCGSGVVKLTAPNTYEGYRWYTDTTTTAVSTTLLYEPVITVTTDHFFSGVSSNISDVSGNACESYRAKITATVHPIPTISLSPVTAICPAETGFSLAYADLTGDADEYSVTSADFPGFSALTDETITATALSIPVPQNTPAGTYNFVLKLKNSTTNCESLDIPFTVRVKEPTVITTQPLAAEVCETQATSFTVSATGEGTLGYQWLKDGNPISGEVSATLSISAAALNDAADYSCRATAECGIATSTEAKLTVNPQTVITQQPQNVSKCEGGSATFTIVATGTGTLSYQWKKNGVDIGINSNEFIINNLTNADNAASISCVVTSSKCGDLTSDAAALTVNPLPAAPSVTSPTGFCKDATTTSLAATPTGANTLLWWGTDASGGTSATAAPTPATATVGSTTYYVSQRDANNCEGSRAAIEVIVSPPVAVSISASRRDICATGVLNSSAILQALPSGGDRTFTYAWRNSGGILSGENSASITALTASAYTVGVTSGYCEAEDNFTVNAIFPELTIAPSVADANVCYLETATLTATSTYSGGDFRWYDIADGTAALSSANPLVISNLTSNRTVYAAYRKTDGLTACETPRKTVNVTVSPQLTIVTQPEDVTKCKGNTANFSAAVTNATSYQWQRKLPGGTFEDMTGEIDADLRISSIGNTANPHLTQYRLIASNGSCSVTTNEVTLTVNSKDANLDSQTACLGSDVTFSVPATTGIIQSYEWQKRTGSSGSFNAITGANAQDLLIENVGIAEDNTYYRCRLVFDNGDGSTCVITTDDGRLTVKEVTVSLSKEDVKCFGDATGSITATASGSTGYEYQLGSGVFQSFDKFENLIVGTYTVHVKDGNGCTAMGDIEIIEPIKLSLTMSGSTLKCNGDNDGVITATVTGGIPDYGYKLADGNFSVVSRFENLTAGSYTVTAKDGNGCETTETVLVEEPAPITISGLTTTPASCSGATGSITFDASGGNGELKFKLGDGLLQTTTSFTDLAAGTYLITVRDATGCEAAQSVTVGGDVTPDITTQPTNVTKCSGNTANFSAAVTNATSYQWQRKLPGGTFEDMTGEIDADLRISSIGNTANPHLTQYRLIASNGSCSVTTNEVTLTVNSKDANLDSQTACLGSDVTFSVPATTGTIQSYEWQKRTGSSGSFNAITGANAQDLLIENVGIAEDNTYYRCRLVFDNGDGSTCVITTDDGRLTVKEVTVSLSKEDLKCFGENTGSITATASGSSGYEYQLGSGSFQSSNKFENLIVGTYTVNVKDGNGCTATENATITAPTQISISNLVTTPATCDGAIGSISFDATGGTGALKFKLNDGNFQSTSTFSNLSGGTYKITAEDESGCTTEEINIVVGGKAVPVITAQPTDLTNCEGNTITFEVTASNVSTYQWQQQLSGGTFNDITGENTEELRLTNVGNSTNPHSAKYRVLLQNDGCDVFSDPATLNVNSITGSTEDKTLCVGTDYTLDLTDFTFTGTISAYQWQYRSSTSGSWTDLAGGTTESYTLTNPQTANSGYYRCRITFINSSGTCIEYNETGNGLKIELVENTPPVVIADRIQVCDAGAATLTASGCNGIVAWSTNETGNSISTSSAGSYTATCKLDNCESAASIPIVIRIGTSPTIPVISSDTLTLCDGQLATLTATNCNGTVVWSTTATGSSIEVGDGTYTALCETACGTSSVSNELTIESNTTPSGGTIEATAATNCAGYNPPTISSTVDPTGEDLTIQWQQRTTSGSWLDIDGATSETYNPGTLSDTTLYRRKVSNTCGEAFSNVDTIYIAPDPGVIVTSSKTLVCANETFTLNAAVTGGSGGCPISWQRNDRSSAPTSSFWEDIEGTTESLTINSSTNSSSENASVYYRAFVDCQPSSCNKATADAAEVVVKPSFEVTLNTTDSTICEGNTLNIIADNCGGTISWSTGESTLSISVSPATSTSYTATCTTDCGSASETANITVLPGGVPLPVNTTPDNVVIPDVLTFSANGTNLKWYDSESGGTGAAIAPTFTELGTYTYWVTQSDGRCESNRLKIEASIYPPLALNAISGDQYDCKGNSVSFFADAVGAGTLTYQWQRKRPDETEFTDLTEDGNGIRFFYGPVLRVSGVGNINNPHLTKYRCVVKDAYGTLVTDEMTLRVNSLQGTFKNAGACIGTNYNEDISVLFAITGQVSEYQWQRRSGTSGPWDDLTDTDRIKGTSTPKIQISPLQYADGDLYYRCKVTFNTGGLVCAENTDASRLTVSGYPSAPPNLAATYCQDDKAKQLSYKTGNSNDVLWYTSATQQEGDTKAPTPNTETVGSFKYFVSEITPQGCEGPKADVNIRINPKPTAPRSTTPEFVKEGNALRFTATGENVKWYTSRTGRTHTIATPTYFKPRLYKHYVSQTSEFGCESDRTYIEARIREALAISRMPNSEADCNGNSVTFRITASSFEDVSYQWQRKRPDEEVYAKLNGETERTLNVRDVGENGNVNGSLYRCVVKDSEDSLTSVPAELIVNEVIGEIPDVAFCEGQRIVLDSTKIKTTGLVERYEWQRQLGRSWFTIDSTSKWLDLGIADSSKTADFRLKVIFKVNERTTCNRYSPETKVVVNKVPDAPNTTDYIVCKFTKQRLKIEPSTKGNTIRWYGSLTDTTGSAEHPDNLSATVGKQTFYLTEKSDEGCESKRTPLNFTTLSPPPKPVTDSLINACQFASDIELNATSENTILWSTDSEDDLHEERPEVSTLIVGSQQFFVAAIDTNGCLSESQQVLVNTAPCVLSLEDAPAETCNTLTRENVNGSDWVNFFDTSGKLLAAVHPDGQDLGTVILNYRLSAESFNTPNGTPLFGRYINLSKSENTPLSRPVRVRLFAYDEEITAFNESEEWFVTHYEGANEDCDPLNNDNFEQGRSTVLYGNISVNKYTSETSFFEFETDSFSEFGLTSNPFSRITSQALVAENRVIIESEIISEIRPLAYFIERSKNGKIWYEWLRVGNDEIRKVADNQPFDGSSFYRIVYRDLDGTLKYFAPLLVDLTDTEPICSVFPNPIIERQQVNLYVRNMQPENFEFYDLQMRKWGIAVNNTEPNNYELTLSSSLAHGTYFVRLTDAGEKSCVVKIVKR